MAKRGPQFELTDRNWDQEEEPEEAGVFKQASEDIIQQRMIKKAKRRMPESEAGDKKKSAFGGFGGLVTSKPSLNTSCEQKSEPIKFGGFASNVNSSNSFKPGGKGYTVFGGGGSASMATEETNKNSSSSSSKHSNFLQSLKSLNESVLAWIKQHVEENPYIILTPVFHDYEKYIATMDKPPSDPFKSTATSGSTATFSVDSSKNLAKPADFQPNSDLFGSSKSSSMDVKTKAENTSESTKDSSSKSTFSFGSTSSSLSNGTGFKFSATSSTIYTSASAAVGSNAPSNSTSSGFSFGGTTSTSKSSAIGSFSFGKTSMSSSTYTSTGSSGSSVKFGEDKSNGLGGFTFASSSGPKLFGSAAGFSFDNKTKTDGLGSSGFGSTATSSGFTGFGGAAAAAANAQASTSKDEDEDYVPPKPEVKEIKEKDSVYSKRCKLFYKKDDQWSDRGVGNIHLKAVDETKTQIVVRADTNLGNILLNILLNESLPISRQGKNNILLVCAPNPPIKEGEDSSKPVPMLIRVKTSDDADELLAKLEERKKLLL